MRIQTSLHRVAARLVIVDDSRSSDQAASVQELLLRCVCLWTYSPLLVSCAAEREPDVEGLPITRVAPNRHVRAHGAHNIAGAIIDEAAKAR
jgi:hypothetical protein